MEDIKSFSEVLGNTEQLAGEKKKMIEIEGKEIVVRAFKTIPDSFNEGKTVTIIQFDMSGQTCITFSRSGVLLKQLDVVREQLPLKGKIVRNGKYFTFV